ncbi:NUDIX hydrolase [Rhodoferax mekongensis]|uniref:NUDIX hydrolase n=1 Tax=Rhodoferax mekongensis TaxID=3068341 RepID=UPI0028BD8899|nr:NUDIX domain-containing protein [Rhodoferax sp. TBRC 17199]MDT7514516.1 NUDIX domain-containing protein [Rhodoferax sp. TBRC 17199]
MLFETLANPAELRAHALAELQKYSAHFPAESAGLKAIAELLADTSADPFSRANMQGHITTSGLVYDAAVDKVLLIHHRTLNRWLQPGGHHEGLDRLDVSAAREVEEETGVQVCGAQDQTLDAPLIDIDSHAIPANPGKGEGVHVHHDFLYLFRGDATAPLSPQWEEVQGVRWVARETLLALPSARFGRLVSKLRLAL